VGAAADARSSLSNCQVISLKLAGHISDIGSAALQQLQITSPEQLPQVSLTCMTQHRPRRGSVGQELPCLACTDGLCLLLLPFFAPAPQAAAGTDSCIHIISVVEAAVITQLPLPQGPPVVDLSPAAEQPGLVLSLLKDGTLQLWHVLVEQCLWAITTDAVTAVSTTNICQCHGPQCSRQLQGQPGSSCCCCNAPKLTYLCAACICRA
jgi:hypothetical protein